MNRKAIFISHANPEDNAFTLWLGAKLSALGYEVWADVLRLNGGDDWQRKLEHALRILARKVLLIANMRAVEKQGVRNEIQIASDVAKKIGDHEFIIPLRLGPFEAPFLIAHAQYIDFQRGWMTGLSELLATLDTTYKVPRTETSESQLWHSLQLQHARDIKHESEILISNWVRIAEIPRTIRCYHFRRNVWMDRAKERMCSAPWPLLPFRRGFLSLAAPRDLREHLGPDLPVFVKSELDLQAFLASGMSKLGIHRRDARNHFSDLSTQAIEKLFRTKGLTAYELSGRRNAWWAQIGIGPAEKVAFRWGDICGKRQIQGVSNKIKMHWHFGVQVAIRTNPMPHVRFRSTLVFTSDGQRPIGDLKRMHRIRRSFARSWRNARWRDMTMAFLYWLSAGRDSIRVPMGSEDLVLALPPMTWRSPVSVSDESELLESNMENVEEEAALYFDAEQEESDEDA